MVIFSFLFLAGCKDDYLPLIKELDKDILVVEGYIDGANETIISLSKVNGMGQSSSNNYITGATVHIEDDTGNMYPLHYSSKGDYKGKYSLNPLVKYRVKFQTNQKEYASQFVQYKVSPPIDSITYKIEPEGARFMVNTHDNTGQSKYYRWQYEETWQFRSYYRTDFRFDAELENVVDLKVPIYDCWQSDQYGEILLNSSANLGEDVMRDIPLAFIRNGSEKLSYIYSIEVKQYAMDSVGYAFYRLLKRNTEETGSIFDPQPGNLKGNVVNLNDPLEMVVGYIGAGRPSVRRQFFTIPWNFDLGCRELVTVPKIKGSMIYYFLGGYWPVSENTDEWIGATNNCVDCRTRGTNIKPDFWP